MLRIRANASENVKGIVSCEASVEVVDELGAWWNDAQLGDLGLKQDFIAKRIESQLSRLHTVLRNERYKLAVDNGL